LVESLVQSPLSYISFYLSVISPARKSEQRTYTIFGLLLIRLGLPFWYRSKSPGRRAISSSGEISPFVNILIHRSESVGVWKVI